MTNESIREEWEKYENVHEILPCPRYAITNKKETK